jgi:hypothetical protein
MLVFRRWQCQSNVLFSPLHFKILLAIENISAHAWSLDTAQAIVGSSCLIFYMAPSSATASDLS